eukprot:1113198-Lingulodinium_polyedra.AAC.1
MSARAAEPLPACPAGTAASALPDKGAEAMGFEEGRSRRPRRRLAKVGEQPTKHQAGEQSSEQPE